MKQAPKELTVRAKDAWHRYWFAPIAPYWIAMCRIFVGYQLFRYVRDREPWNEFSGLGVLPTLPEDLWDPISFVAVLNLPPPSSDVLTVIWWITLAAAVAVTLGAGTRLTSVVAALGGLYLLTLPNCFGKINHGYNVLALMVLVLPFCRMGAALSVDAVLRKLRGRPTPVQASHFNWPVKLIQFSFAFMLFFAGWHKVVVGGPGWVLSDNLRNTLLYQNLLVRSETPASDLVMQVANTPVLWKAAAAAALLGELSFILIMFTRRWWARAALVGVGAGFLIGLDVFMGLPNPTLLWLLPVFVNWNWIAERLPLRTLRETDVGDEPPPSRETPVGQPPGLGHM